MTLFTYSIFFLTGILSSFWYPKLPNPYFLLILIVVIFVFYNKNKNLLFFIVYLFGLILASTSCYKIKHSQWILSQIYYKPVLLTLKLDSVTENHFKFKNDNSLIVTSNIICVEPNKRPGENINIYDLYRSCVKLNPGLPIKLYLSGISLNEAQKFVDQNSIVQVNTVLKPHISLHNFIDNNTDDDLFHGYSYKPLNINYQDIYSLKQSSNFFKKLNFRNKLLQKFLEYSRGIESHGIVIALLFGVRDYIPPEHIQIFAATGTGHLIAISGMHVSLVFYIILVFSQYIWRIKIYKYYNKRNFSVLTSWFFTIFYGYISGVSVPTQRALVSVSVLAFTQFYYLRLSVFNIFGICLISVLIIEPLAVTSASFWLSFNATFWLLYIVTNSYDHKFHESHDSHDSSNIHSIQRDKLNKSNVDYSIYYLIDYYKVKIFKVFKSNLESCTKLFFALLPITIYYFNSFSFASVLANMIAIPLVSIIILPLLIFVLIIFIFVFFITDQFNTIETTIKALLYLADVLLNYLIKLLNLLVSSQYLYLDRYSLVILTVITFLLLAPRGFPKWPVITSLSILFYFYRFNYSNISIDIPIESHTEQLVIDVLDVGQGLAILVNTKHHQLLYDTGPKLHYNFIADKIVTNSLLNYKKKSRFKLDAIVISHWDADHSANIEKILSNVLVGNNYGFLFANKINFYSSHLQKNIIYQNKFNQLNAYYCNADLKWEWDGVEFSFLKTFESNIYLKNNSSCILKITYDNKSILLTGDIEHQVEKALISKHKNIIRSDVLLVPHHGSKTSSSLEFIRQVAPKYALISVGKDNIYHLPNNDIIKRYKQLGIKIFRTDLHGGIKVIVNNDKIYVNRVKNI